MPASSEKTSIAFLSCHFTANVQKIHFPLRDGNYCLCCHTLPLSGPYRAGIFFSQSWEQRSTTHRRLVLIKLPLIPLSVLAPSPPPPSLTGGIRRGASLGRMGQKSEFNGSLCSGEKKTKNGYSVERREMLLRSTKKETKGERKWQQQVSLVWAIHGECTAKCESGLSCPRFD